MLAVLKRAARWITTHHTPTILVVACFAVFCLALWAHPALAQEAQTTGEVSGIESGVARIIGAIAAFVGYVVNMGLIMAVNVLVIVANYNQFVTSAAVERGWTIVRDLTNMFFVLVMLIIAFGTILGLEEYSYKRMLPRLLIMAVLINFSKTIAGVMIDFAQVVMITFVDGFAAVAAGNFLQMFHLNSFLSSDPAAVASATQNRVALWSSVGSLILAALMMLIALVAVAIMVIMLVFRIVMLWLLIVMSPLAFFLSAFPKGKAASAYAKWWELFGNYVVVGPFIAFFLWLSLAVTGSGDLAATQGVVATGQTGATSLNLFTSQGGRTEVLISFIIGISMLLAGMTLASSFGTMGGSMMSGAASWFQQQGVNAVTKPFGAARHIAGSYAKIGEAKFAKSTGIHLPGFGYYTTGWKKGLDARVASAEGGAKKSIDASIAKGGWRSYTRKFFGDPEAFSRDVGLIKAATLPVSAPYYMGKALVDKMKGKPGFAGREWEVYADTADQHMRNREDLEKQREGKRGELQQHLSTARTEAEQIAGTAGMPAAVRQQAEERANALGGMITKLSQGQSLDDDDRARLRDLRNQVPEDQREEMTAARVAIDDINAIGKEIAEQNREYNLFSQKAAISRARGGGVPAEMAKHGQSGFELAALYELAKRQDNKDAMTSILKKALTSGEEKDFAKALNIEFKGENMVEDMKRIFASYQKDTGATPRAVMEVASEVSATNKGKEHAASNFVTHGAAGSIRWSEYDEQQAGKRKDMNKGDAFGGMIRKGLTKNLGSVNENKVLDLDAAGALTLANEANIAKLIKAIEQNKVGAVDMDVLKRSFAQDFEGVANQMRAVAGNDRTQFDRINADIARLREKLAAYQDQPSVSNVIDEFVRRFPREGAAPRPRVAARRVTPPGGGGGGTP